MGNGKEELSRKRILSVIQTVANLWVKKQINKKVAVYIDIDR